MLINLRGIQNTLENKIAVLDSLKSHGWEDEFEIRIGKEEEGIISKDIPNMDEKNLEEEISKLKCEINDLFDSFEQEIILLDNNDIITERYGIIIQNLKHDYLGICKSIDSRKRKFSLFRKQSISRENKYQKLSVDNNQLQERADLYKEKNALKDSISSVNSMIEQALRTTQSLNNQKQILKFLLDKTHTMKNKSIRNIQNIFSSISNLKMKQDFVILIVFVCLILIIVLIKNIF
ncbi:Golgi SNAP receptor complex subunit 1 [Cryptosporidium felis]|nr:Golgi SNAP receptor complex subunit 1 [Cryptosporidium felis]